MSNKLLFKLLVLSFVGGSLLACSSLRNTPQLSTTNNIKYLALGDSYTYGESVCARCSFPHQLQQYIETNYLKNVELTRIARTGWTTTDLLKAIDSQKLDPQYELITLLIGVNNQYQGKDFNLYKEEFPILLEKAIKLAGGNNAKVIVLSIPDYAFTPFGKKSDNSPKISKELDEYNLFAKRTAEKKDVTFLDITKITRQGLENKNLVASDGLHPSSEAYNRFVKELIPVVKKILD